METTAPSIKDIIAKTVRPLLRLHHLNRDVIIGWIGPRGGGKSLGAAITAALDYGIEGDILRSNMQITWDIEASEALALRFGFESGTSYTAHYESQELNKHKFLTYNPEYFRSVYVIDEINLWLADARRAMAQQNLLADDVAQQLRKWQSPLFYTCIHEMFVDSRIRGMTDLFIKTEDSALTEDGLRRRQGQGINFRWYLYPMTKKFTGHTYQETRQAIGPISINGKMLWDIIDTLERQERKKYKPEDYKEDIPVNIKEDPVVVEDRNQWGWLYEKILQLHQNEILKLEDDTLWEYLEIKERGLTTFIVGRQLKAMGITTKPSRQGHFVYEIDQFDLDVDLLNSSKASAASHII